MSVVPNRIHPLLPKNGINTISLFRNYGFNRSLRENGKGKKGNYAKYDKWFHDQHDTNFTQILSKILPNSKNNPL